MPEHLAAPPAVSTPPLARRTPTPSGDASFPLQSPSGSPPQRELVRVRSNTKRPWDDAVVKFSLKLPKSLSKESPPA